MYLGILLLSLPLLLNSLPAFSGDDLYRFKNKKYSVDDLDPYLKQRLYEIKVDYNGQVDHLISNRILELHVKELSKKQNKHVHLIHDELFKVEITEKEMKKFYEENRDRIPYEYEKAKPQVQRFLVSKAQSEKRDTYLNNLKKKGKYVLFLPEPQAPVFAINVDNFPTKGNQKAKTLVVEFSDYQCPHCKEANSILQKLHTKYKNNVKFVHIDFPINSSGISKKVSRGSYCAKQQNKYWEYHNLAFNKQGSLNANSPNELATELKLDMKKFNECYQGQKSQKYVEQALAEAERLGLSGTPAFFVNGKRLLIRDMPKDLEGIFANSK